MPGPRSVTRTSELRIGRRPRAELSPAAAGVLEGVARDLGDRGGDAGLILGVEASRRGDLARALAREHDVLLGSDRRS